MRRGGWRGWGSGVLRWEWVRLLVSGEVWLERGGGGGGGSEGLRGRRGG